MIIQEIIMSHKFAAISFAALLGFTALPAQAHISALNYLPEQTRYTDFIQQDLEKILPDITNVEPDLFDYTSYDVTAPARKNAIQPQADDNGVDL
jgi:hypothetical protein